MKTLRICLALFAALLIAAPTFAQSLYTAQVDPGAQMVGSFTTTVTLSSKVESKGTADVGTMIMVWATNTGKVSYQIATESIKVSGDGSVIDQYSTQEIFGLLSYAGISRGVMMGYTQCSSICSNDPASLTKVYQSNCVRRSGSGLTTHFKSCDSSLLGNKAYSVCCPGGDGTMPVINLVQSNPVKTECQNGVPCESTF